jgi:hypothetical protein
MWVSSIPLDLERRQVYVHGPQVRATVGLALVRGLVVAEGAYLAELSMPPPRLPRDRQSPARLK